MSLFNLSLDTQLISELLQSEGYTQVHKNLASKIGFVEAGAFQHILSKFTYELNLYRINQNRNQTREKSKILLINSIPYIPMSNPEFTNAGFRMVEVRAAKKKLVSLGLVATEVKGTPPTTYYTLPSNLSMILSDILFKIDDKSDKDQIGHIQPINQSYMTEYQGIYDRSILSENIKIDKNTPPTENPELPPLEEPKENLKNDNMPQTISNIEQILKPILAALAITIEDMQHPELYRAVMSLNKFLTENKITGDTVLAVLELEKKTRKEKRQQEPTLKEKLQNMYWGGWINSYNAEMLAKKLEEKEKEKIPQKIKLSMVEWLTQRSIVEANNPDQLDEWDAKYTY